MMHKIMSIIACLSLVLVIFLPDAVFGTSEGLAQKTVTPESYISGSGNRETIRLSADEKNFIKNHPVIKVSNELDYPPFDFAIEGQPQGYTIDLLDLLAQKIGIRIEYINGYTWDEIVQLFRERRIDLLHSLVKTDGREEFMLFSDRFFRDRQMYITRKEHPDITDIKQLYGKTISQGKNWSTVELLRKNYPQIPLLMVDNLEGMLSAVAYGKVDATIADEAATSYMMKQKGMSDLKFAGWVREIDQFGGLNFHFAGQKDAPELISMINKALASLSAEEWDGLKRKWFGNNDVNETLAKPVDLNENEKAFLASHSIIRVHNEQDWAPFNFYQNGQPKGYTIDMLNLLAKKLNVRFEYVSGPTWDEFMAMLKKREIDVIGNMVRTEERKTFARFTEHPMIPQIPYLASRSNAPYKSIQQLAGKTIAVVKGFWYENALREHYPEVRLQPHSNTLQCLEAVAFGDADATIGIGAVMQHIWLENSIGNLALTGEVNLPGSEGYFDHIGVRKDWPLLVSALDKAMATVTYNEKKQLKLKWFGEGSDTTNLARADVAGIPLERGEQLFLKDIREITYCVDPDWMPFERINDKGRHEGMTADLMKDIERRLGVKLRLVPTDSWSETLLSVREGRCQFISAAAETIPRKEYLDFTEPHGEYPLVVAVSNEELFVENLEAIRDKTIGVVKGYAHADLIRERYPNFRIVEVDNVRDGLTRVRSHEIFGFVDTAPTIGYQLRRQDIKDLKIGGKLDIPLKLSFAVPKGAPPELLSILDKALNSFSEEEKKVLADKWFSIKIEKVYDYTRFWQVFGVVMAVFILILFWNRKLARLNRSLEEARRAADAANLAKSAFFANMSHELRTPLNVMLGFAQLLTRSPDLSSEQRTSLETIGRSGDHLLALINDVLEFSKIEAGKTGLKAENFDLRRFLLGLEEMFRLRVRQRGLHLKFIIDEDVPRYIRAEKNKLRQVLINLLGNAVKFTDQGEIILQVCPETGDSSCRLRFTVSDTGIGIPPADQNRIFDAFYQAGGEQSSVKGTGLGLTISHKFVELMGGKLEVERGPGRGSRFSFDLPIELVETKETETARSKGRVIGRVPGDPECRLLVAEDDPDSRTLLATLLRSVGFAVREAANGREALDIWRQWRPQLIWMDIRMPLMDGLSTIREIRKLPGGDQTVIVGLTAFAFEEDKQMVMAAGGDDFVRKPCTEEEIFSCLEKHLGVCFQYAKENHHPPDGNSPDRLDPTEAAALLADLPEALLSRFDEAVRQSDVAGIEQGIEEICRAAPQLGHFFQKLAADFAYDEIARYLDKKEC